MKFLVAVLAATSALAIQTSLSIDSTLDKFVAQQTVSSLQHIQANIHPNGGIAASPSTDAPNYYYHWIRDGSLTMKSLLPLYEKALRTNDTASIAFYENKFWTYVSHERLTQINTDTFGRAKFTLDTTSFVTKWGCPQNDGSGLRAITLIKFANLWLDVKGGPISAFVDHNLYVAEFPAHSLVKSDLEFVSQAFLNEDSTTNMELWEEVYARAHLYTRAAQRTALIEGAKFASRMGDAGAASWYLQVAQQIHNAIQTQHWSPSRDYLLETLDPTPDSVTYKPKPANLDLGAVLAGLHHRDTILDATWGSDIARFDSGEILLTAMTLANRFNNIYPINKINKNADGQPMAPGIGRYPEDVYDGYGTSLGNPWFLANLGFAELTYAIAAEWCTLGQIPLTNQTATAINWILQGGLFGSPISSALLPNDFGTSVQTCKANPTLFSKVLDALVQGGDAHIRRVQYHLPNRNVSVGYQIGSISEEFNRVTGNMQGAIELTWSHASFVTLSQQRAISKSATCACN